MHSHSYKTKSEMEEDSYRLLKNGHQIVSVLHFKGEWLLFFILKEFDKNGTRPGK